MSQQKFLDGYEVLISEYEFLISETRRVLDVLRGRPDDPKNRLKIQRCEQALRLYEEASDSMKKMPRCPVVPGCHLEQSSHRIINKPHEDFARNTLP